MFPDQVQIVARETAQKFEVPGIAVLAQRQGDAKRALYFGADAVANPVTPESLFLVASITKLATALTVLRLADMGALALDDALGKFLPDARAAQPGVTIRALLCHISGLPQDLANEHELYGAPLTWRDLAKECLKVGLERPPHSRVVYGNVGYGLLAVIVERLVKKQFTDALRELVLEPLDITGYLGQEPPRPPMQLADVHSRHVGTALEPYNSRYYRSLGFPWSGLITNADGALKLVRAFAGDPRNFLSPTSLFEATRNQTDALPGGYGGRFDYPLAPWGLGVDLRGEKKPHWTPSSASPNTFGHAGASGCVVWHDPEKGVSWAILGTRTADNAWLVRGAPKIGQAILESWRQDR